MNKELIEYHETMFSKIKKFFKRFLFRKKEKNIVNEINHNEINHNDNFLEKIIANESTEEKRLRQLKKLYDDGEVNEKDITNEDIDKLIEMYDKEIEELRANTEKRKNNIKQIIKINETQRLNRI